MLKEHLLITRDDEMMLLKMEVEEDSFLDFILSLKERGFNYHIISEKLYNYYKDDLNLKGYTAGTTAIC